MDKLKCGCIIAEFCEKHGKDDNEKESDEINEKLAVIEAAELVLDYIEENNLPHPCLRDDLTDFISSYDTEGS